MSTLSTSMNNNINSDLKNEITITIKKPLKSSSTEANCIYSLRMHDIKNLYNKLDYTQLKGLKRYENFPIFIIREKKMIKKKKKLILRMRKNFSMTNKFNTKNNIKTQSSLYVTQNLNEGNFTQLPNIIEKLETINKEKIKRNINNERNKFKRKNEPKENFSEVGRKPQIKVWFLNRLKNNIEKHNEEEERKNKVKNNLFKRKIKDTNIYRKTENSYLTYIDKIHEFLSKKKYHDLKKEKLFHLEVLENNKISLIKDKIKIMHKSQGLLDNYFILKYQEYLTSLYKEKDKQDKKDIILCSKIYELRNDIKVLDKKIKKLMKEKNIYRKWLVLQVQVKNKLLNIPKEYQELIKLDNNKKLPYDLMQYVKNIIYPSPQDLINRIENYENYNIKSLEIYHRIINEIYPLKEELEKELKICERFSNFEEINDLMELKLKLKSKNEILKNQLYSLKKDKTIKIFSSKNARKKGLSKIYEKIKLMKINIVQKKGEEDENINENIEMLNILKEIELEIDIQKNKQKFYLITRRSDVMKAKEKIEKEKRIEKIKKNKKIVIEKQTQLRERIIEKANKQFIIPNMRINWTVYNVKKNYKKNC